MSEYVEILKAASELDRENKLALMDRWRKTAKLHKDSISRLEKRGSLASAERSRVMLEAYEEAIAGLEDLLNE